VQRKAFPITSLAQAGRVIGIVISMPLLGGRLILKIKPNRKCT
jgi:hypothetical protein